jgi:5'-methylthioadenosine phosphorylase
VTSAASAAVGVFGGSGFYAFLANVSEVAVDTPYGRPSAPVAVGDLDGVRVAFLPRHGPQHELLPHQINYRANLWAMRELGVQRVFGPCAAGSLQPGIAPGDFVVCDQLVDRTKGRVDSFAHDERVVAHVSWADPYCPEVGAIVSDAAAREGITVHRGGTVVVIEGPRFSTRAESAWYRQMGAHVINMTQYPEAYLARELGMCYAAIALVTDYDVGVEGVDDIKPVTMEEVFKVLEANVERTRGLLFRAIPRLPAERSCDCQLGLSMGPIDASRGAPRPQR